MEILSNAILESRGSEPLFVRGGTSLHYVNKKYRFTSMICELLNVFICILSVCFLDNNSGHYHCTSCVGLAMSYV